MTSIDGHRPSVGSAVSSVPSNNDEGLPSLRRMANSLSMRAKNPIKRRHRNNSVSSANNTSLYSTSPREFEHFPTSFRKRYPCSAERIRVEEQAATDERKKLQRSDRSLDTDYSPSFLQFSDVAPRPRTADDHRFTRRKSAMCLNARHTAACRIVTSDDALWYQSLPDKIRRQQFSQAEQRSLAERCEAILSSIGKSPSDNAAAITTFYEPDAEQRTPSLVNQELDARQSGGSISEKNDVHRETSSSTHTLQSMGELTTCYATTFDDPLDRSCSATPPPIALTRKVSTARSLVPIPLPPPKLAPLPTVPDEAPSPVRPTSSPATNFSWRRDLTSEVANPPEVPPTIFTPHYQDSATRRILRNHLTSAHAFDDVVEFGFPVYDSTGSIEPDEASSQRQASSIYSDDGTCLSLESQGPLTPTTVSSQQKSCFPQVSASVDSNIACAASVDKQHRNDSCTSLSVSQREMTIRMTLTRPEIHGVTPPVFQCRQISESRPHTKLTDPLALEALTFSDDDTGAHGAFAIHRSASHGDKFKMALRSLRGRS
nr:hypothetical protein CFP56_22211 [Quercus suber]